MQSQVNKMDSFKDRVNDFLQLKQIAVVGVSLKSGPANAIFDKFKSAGFEVTPIHPVMESFSGVLCFRQVTDMPVAPEGVSMLTRLDLTLEVTQ